MDGGSPPATERVPALAPAAAPDDGALFCPECDYDLRATESDRCPECGLAFDRTQLGVSRIPWSHRRRIGRARAYWRTVWLATFHTRRLAAEVARPVDYRDAQRFRLVTALIAAAGPVALVAAAVVQAGGIDALAGGVPSPVIGFGLPGSAPGPVYDVLLPWAAGALLAPVVPLATALFMVALTGVATYWFHPRSLPVLQQNRAVALGYYACAPLAFLPLPSLAVGAMMAMDASGLAGVRGSTSRPFLVVGLFTPILLLLVVLAFYVATLRLLRRSTRAGAGRMALAAVVIPVTWALSAALTLFGLPWVVGFVWVVIDSLG